MKIKNKLNERELELLNKINIIIENREYNWEELEEIKDNLVIRGEISNMDKNENSTSLSDEYSNLVDKFIEFINKE